MKKSSICVLFLLLCANIFAQETIKANLEIICSIPVSGDVQSEGTVYFYCNDMEEYSPLGPLVDGKGNLYFYDYFTQKKIVYSNGKVTQEQINKAGSEGRLPMRLEPTSCNGIVTGTNGTFLAKNDSFYSYPYDIKSYDFYNYFFFKNGVLYIYDEPENSFALNITEKKITVIENSQLKDWLKLMGYSVNENKIYKNGRMIAPLSAEKQRSFGHAFLRSYHEIYESKEKFKILNQAGKVVLQIELPEKKLYNQSNNFPRYSYGFGNYGEIYLIIGPDSIGKVTQYVPSSGNAEIYVVRNHLKYFGVLNDDRIRLRKGPGTDTESLGTYSINTGFMILEDSGVSQTIDGVTKTWIKVQLLDGTEGYFFGQYVKNLYDGPGTPLPWPNVADWN